jgi:hypothetical protein
LKIYQNIGFNYKEQTISCIHIPLIIQLNTPIKFTHTSQIEKNTFLIQTQLSIGSLKTIDVKNQLPISFGTALVSNKIVKKSLHTHKFVTVNLLLHIKHEPNVIRKKVFFSLK